MAVVGDPRAVRLHGGGMTATDSPRTGDVLGQALAYAAAGWPVFPTRPNAEICPVPERCPCKAPVTPNGFKDATDPAQIRGWWRRWPDANAAVATGAPGPDVLDIDIKPAGSGFAALNEL